MSKPQPIPMTASVWVSGVSAFCLILTNMGRVAAEEPLRQAVPGSRADLGLQQQVANNIYLADEAKHPSCSRNILSARVLKEPDETNAWIEEWTVDSCHQPSVYRIAMQPLPKGEARILVASVDTAAGEKPAAPSRRPTQPQSRTEDEPLHAEAPSFDEMSRYTKDGAVPGTMADAQLQRDIVKAIVLTRGGNLWAGDCTPVIVKADGVGTTQTGAFSFIERWSVESCQSTYLIEVTLTPTPQGGVIFKTHPLGKSGNER